MKEEAMSKKVSSHLGVWCVVLLLAQLASVAAITIVPNYGTGFGPGTAQRAVFEDKIARWAAYPCLCHYTVTIDVSMADLGPYAKAPLPLQPGVEYTIAKNPLDPSEQTILGQTSNWTFDVNGYPTHAQIQFNSHTGVSWSWTVPPAVPGPTEFDGWSVANHEIAHAVGFTVFAPRFNAHVVAGPPRTYDLGGGASVNLTPASQGTHTSPTVYPNDIMNPSTGPGTRREMSQTVLDVLRHAFPGAFKIAGKVFDELYRIGPRIYYPTLPWVIVWHRQDTSTYLDCTLTDSTGRYAFTNLRRGKHTIGTFPIHSRIPYYPPNGEHSFQLESLGTYGLWFTSYEQYGVNVGCRYITAPAGAVDSGTVVVPACSVYNYGMGVADLGVRLAIGDLYSATASVLGLAPGASCCVTFPVWAANMVGEFVVSCSTELDYDEQPANDRMQELFAVTPLTPPPPSGWQPLADLPLGIKDKKVKDGGCLAAYQKGDTDCVYALKGNNRLEFYRYNRVTNTWTALESIPVIGRSGKKKAVKKGATLAKRPPPMYCHAYATKGNNTLEFWEFDPTADAYPWIQMADVPAGVKTIKEGAGAAAVVIADTCFIYFLKGSGTQEFYRYNTVTNVWEPRADAPLGLSGKPFKKGSCLADGNPNATALYVLKGGYNEFYAYDIAANAWATLTSLPFIGSSGKKKKAGDGAELARAGGKVFALKGNNTLEFWFYDPAGGAWTQLEDMPLGAGKKVKGGGALTHAFNLTDATGSLYAFKGNNTLEFYDYPLTDLLALTTPATNAAGNSTLAGELAHPRHPSLVIGPNPFTNATTITYSLPQAGNVSLRLYDVTGTLVTTLVQGYHTAGSSSFVVHGSSFARGIYLLKLETGDYRTTQKLILE
jgi:hypothetical protein